MSWHLNDWFVKEQKQNEADNKMLINDKNKCQSSQPPAQKWMMREIRQNEIDTARAVKHERKKAAMRAWYDKIGRERRRIASETTGS